MPVRLRDGFHLIVVLAAPVLLEHELHRRHVAFDEDLLLLELIDDLASVMTNRAKPRQSTASRKQEVVSISLGLRSLEAR